MKPAQFRVIRFHLPTGVRYVAMAWNYDQAILISTQDHPTYFDARKELEGTCFERGVSCKWFEGEHVYNPDTGSIEPLKP